MSVIARFEVIPVRDGSMSTAIAAALQALDRHPVSYETTATDTIIEADSAEAVFAAVEDAHRAIPDDRVITSVEIDEDRRRSQDMHQRVASVERELGHPPQRSQQPPAQPPRTQPPAQSTGTQSAGQSAGFQESSPPMGASPTMGSSPAMEPGRGMQPSQSHPGQTQGMAQFDQRPSTGQPVRGGSSGQATANPPPQPTPGPHR